MAKITLNLGHVKQADPNFNRLNITKVSIGKQAALLLLLWLLPLLHFAQIHIEGRVLEQGTQTPLAFVYIVAENQERGAFSDVDGWFVLDLEEGGDSVRFSILGFEKKSFFLDSSQAYLEVVLPQEDIAIETVQITGQAKPADRVIRNVIKNRKKNDIYALNQFSYDSYNKLKVYPMGDSLTGLPVIEDSSFVDMDYLIWETVTKVKFEKPNKSKEEVLASRTSGYQGKAFPLTATDLQSISFYTDQIQIMNERFLSPISGLGLRNYTYELKEVILQEPDTLFLVGFTPKKNNMDGLEGQVWVHSNQWGIKNIKANLLIRGNKVLVDEGRIQQLYQSIGDTMWVPQQLNTDVKLLPFSSQVKGEMIFSGRSYIKEFSADLGEDQVTFDHNAIVVNSMAVENTDSILAVHREEALTPRELNSYYILDSVGKAAKLDLVVDQVYKLQYSTLQLWFLDLDLNRIWHGNNVEGYRPGLGLYTNERISPYFSVGGYWGYGLKDNEHKYGGSLKFFPGGDDDFVIGIGHDNDLEETGGRRLGIEPEVVLWRNTYREPPSRTAFLDQMDYTRDWWGFFAFRPGSHLTFRSDYSQEWVRPAYNYSFEEKTSFRFEEFTGTLRWAPGEFFTDDGVHNFAVENELPVLRMRWRKGLTLFGGQYQYDIFDWSANHQWFFGKGHRLRYRLNGGINTGVVPYSKMYIFRANFHPKNYFDSPNTFNTMRFHEFAANQYLSGFISLRPEQNWLHIGSFRPRFSFVFNAAWGHLTPANAGVHEFLNLQAPNKGYYEGGIVLQNVLPVFRKQNVLNSVIQTLGVSAYYRFGPYSLPTWKENVALRLYTSF